MPIALTAYQGRAGDRNDLAWPGAQMVMEAIAAHLCLPFTTVGCRPQTPLNQGWAAELAAAQPGLTQLADHLRSVLSGGGTPITALNRCAAALATLPVVAQAHPEATIVWFDAHADLNTPTSTASGYLGGMAISGPAGLWHTGFGDAVDLARVVLVGSRDLDPFEAQLIESGPVTLIRADEPDLPGALLRRLNGQPVYVHLDCDVLEPGLVPTDFQVPGGLSLERLATAMEALATLPIVGLEVAEFQTGWSPDEQGAAMAGLLQAMLPLLNAVRDARQTTPRNP